MKIELLDLITVMLVFLKLAGIIHISWLMVFLPLILVVSVLLLTLAILGLVTLKNNVSIRRIK